MTYLNTKILKSKLCLIYKYIKINKCNLKRKKDNGNKKLDILLDKSLVKSRRRILKKPLTYLMLMDLVLVHN